MKFYLHIFATTVALSLFATSAYSDNYRSPNVQTLANCMSKADKINTLAVSLKPILETNAETVLAWDLVEMVYFEQFRDRLIQLYGDAELYNDARDGKLGLVQTGPDDRPERDVALEVSLASVMIEEHLANEGIDAKLSFIVACMQNFSSTYRDHEEKFKALDLRIADQDTLIRELKSQLLKANSILEDYEQDVIQFSILRGQLGLFEKEVAHLRNIALAPEAKRLEMVLEETRLHSLLNEDNTYAQCFLYLREGDLREMCAFELAMYLMSNSFPSPKDQDATSDHSTIQANNYRILKWEAEIIKAFRSKFFYPKGTNAIGTTVIFVEVSKTGSLQALGTRSSSGYGELDRAALSIAKRVTYPAAPQYLNKDTHKLNISVNFQH